MENNPENRNNRNNHQVGRELYNKEHQQDQPQGQQQRYGYRGQDDRQWGEGNYFHTGPSPRGAQDKPAQQYGENYQHDRRSTYAQDRNAHLNDHYGSDAMSSYRNERSRIDHGDRNSSNYQHSQEHSMRRPHTPGGSLQGNRSDMHSHQNDQWREGPGSRSRYKEDDFRYGSGSHNWYREGRYTPDSNDTAPQHHDQRGFMDRVKDTWNDIWHSDDPGYNPRHHQSQSNHLDSRARYGSDQYRNRNFDKGYEGGPRWADDGNSGKDDYYDNVNKDQRYRR